MKFFDKEDVVMKNFFRGKRLCIILVIITVIGIIVAVRSCTEKVDADLTIAYIGDELFNSDVFYPAAPEIEAEIDDINGDGKRKIELVTITFNKNITFSQEQSNMAKMTMSMGQGQSRLYFMDKEYCERYADSEILMDISDIAGGREVLTNEQGKVYAISMNGNNNLRRLGLIDTSEVYAAVRAITEMDYINFKNPGPEEMNEAAMDVLMYILNHNDEEM